VSLDKEVLTNFSSQACPETKSVLRTRPGDAMAEVCALRVLLFLNFIQRRAISLRQLNYLSYGH